jgi:ABC-type multidrug transport system ATPase subunit
MATQADREINFSYRALEEDNEVNGVERPSVQITWTDLVVEVIKRDGNKRILNQVTGGVKPGEFLAVMGPSGAGKTSFLNSISKRN